ncbi:hypothetical protein [Saccharothrix algeriensis]|uniref:Secreted protein n=1 Tax=Saccharothrix algeriensis TaxID=173560 RepID=A0A8T8HTV7_9PSEU|nr:hypothetical protein [Saccharothrix algeriensis]MBM7813239.1 hypothetical protein [Saccharothrix algeriensis]QTR01799.1 hypothetical protein J7S33_21265 [Saccharothrix algeriensis]
MVVRTARAFALAGATFAAAALPLLAAAPAHADVLDCHDFLKASGYEVAHTHALGCGLGQMGNSLLCRITLEGSSVRPADAERACTLAVEQGTTQPG